MVTFSGGVIPGVTTVTGHCPDGNPVPALCRKSWPRGPGRGAGGRGDPSPTNLYSSSKYITLQGQKENVEMWRKGQKMIRYYMVRHMTKTWQKWCCFKSRNDPQAKISDGRHWMEGSEEAEVVWQCDCWAPDTATSSKPSQPKHYNGLTAPKLFSRSVLTNAPGHGSRYVDNQLGVGKVSSGRSIDRDSHLCCFYTRHGPWSIHK